MRFLASRFSRNVAGLLTLGGFASVFVPNLLISNELKNVEVSMTKDRNALDLEDRWNVEALYASPEAWREDYEAHKGKEGTLRWPEIASFKGMLQDPRAAASLLKIYFALDRKLTQLYTYAHLRMDEDLGHDLFKKDYGMIVGLLHDFSKECSWIQPALLSLSERDFANILSHPELGGYRFFLEKIARTRPHTLSAELEELAALAGRALDAPSQAFGALNDADLVFPDALDSLGKQHPLTHGTYLSYLRSQDRMLRASAFKNFHGTFASHANVFCELLQGQVQAHLYHARAHKFRSCLESALFPYHIDPSVYKNLIHTVRQSLPLMHRYIALRKQLLGLSEIHIYDLMVPLVEESFRAASYAEARQSVIDSTALLGQSYQKEVRKGLTEDRWVDVYETPRKRSGAYSSGCYDSMPYILLNYQGTLNDVLTLAHETGHSMHSFLSRRRQSYVDAQYPIFVAEVASTFNEQLLLRELKSKLKSKKELATLLNYQIEGIRSTIFRQTMFAEFELQLHEWAEQGIPLTPALLKEHYMQLNRDYYGSEIVLDPELAIEWARIPHFYYNFYVYQYATGLSAALYLFEKALVSAETREKYLEFLSSGGSLYPLDLLARAGVDMKSPVPVEAAMKRFALLLEELKLALDGGLP